MTNNRNIIASNSLVLVNTAIDSNAIVLLSNTSLGSIVNVRDLTGNVRSNRPIYISTVRSVNFTNTMDSNFLIQQPFGSMSFAATGSNSWSVLNTFAFNTPTPTAVSTPVANISSMLFKDIGINGRASILNISSFIQVDGSNIGGGGGGSEPIVIPNPLVKSNIFASTITVTSSNIPSPVSIPNFVATGLRPDEVITGFGNIQSTSDGQWWANIPGDKNFLDGFGTDIKKTDTHIVFAGFSNSGDTSYFQIYFMTNNSEGSRIIGSNTDFLVSSNAFLKYEKGINGYHAILFNDPINITTRLYYTNNLETDGPWSISTDANIGALYGSATSFAQGNNYYLISSKTTLQNVNSKLVVITDIVSNNSFLHITGSFTIDKIKHSKVDNLFLLAGRGGDGNIFNVFYESTFDLSTSILTNSALLSLDLPTNDFTVYDIYINQFSLTELQVPRVIYVGSSLNNNVPNIYYSYNQNIQRQTDFQSFSNDGSTIYSLTQQDQNIVLSTNKPSGNIRNLVGKGGVILLEIFNYNNNNNLLNTYSVLFTGSSLFALDSYTRVETSGILKTSHITFSNSAQTQNQTLTTSNRSLYRNRYPINPVGAYIEFIYNTDVPGGCNIVSYPLYIGGLSGFSNGWWKSFPTNTPSLFGFTLLPGHGLTLSYGPFINTITNTSTLPINSNVFNPLSNYLEGTYVLNAII